MIRVISAIRSANQKVNYELRELHRNNVSVIREIRSHKS